MPTYPKYKFFKSIWIFAFLLFSVYQSNAQISIDLSTGNVLASNEIEGFKYNFNYVSNFSTRVTYMHNKFGLSLQYSHDSWKANKDFIDQFSSFQTKSVSSNPKWKSNFFYIGPVWKIGGSRKVNFELFPKIGFGKIKSTDLTLSYIASNQNEYLLYDDNLLNSTDKQSNLTNSKW